MCPQLCRQCTGQTLCARSCTTAAIPVVSSSSMDGSGVLQLTHACSSRLSSPSMPSTKEHLQRKYTTESQSPSWFIYFSHFKYRKILFDGTLQTPVKKYIYILSSCYIGALFEAKIIRLLLFSIISFQKALLMVCLSYLALFQAGFNKGKGDQVFIYLEANFFSTA